MLDSVKIARRQSEIRQSLSELVGKDDASEDEVRKIDELDREYRFPLDLLILFHPASLTTKKARRFSAGVFFGLLFNRP